VLLATGTGGAASFSALPQNGTHAWRLRLLNCYQRRAA